MEALETQVQLERVVYELLDAQQDTLELSAEQRLSPEWDIHCAYLRDLQRVALEAVALRD